MPSSSTSSDDENTCSYYLQSDILFHNNNNRQLTPTNSLSMSDTIILSPVHSVYSSSDTDLDIKDNDFLDKDKKDKEKCRRKKQQTQKLDLTRSQTLYLDSCDRRNVNEQVAITRGLESSELNLSSRYLGSIALRPLSLALLRNDQVTVLNLSSNNIDPECALYLARVLRVNCSIKELNLSSNGFGNRGAIAIAELMKNNNSIAQLDISDNQMGDEAGKYLAHGIEENQTIRSLNLSKNNFSEMGAVYLGRGLSENYTIEDLNISWCRLRKKGAVGLCQGIRANVSVLTLDLSWNGLGYEGSLALAEIFKYNKHLRDINVSHCRISWQGALFLAEGLRVNFWLESLKLGGNPLSTTGCNDILESLTGPDSAVTFLDLRGNFVANEFELLAHSIRNKRPFQWMHDGILSSHDLIGQRSNKKKDPMSIVIEYMQTSQVRALELFRSFDKDVMMRMTKNDFIERLQKIGIYLSEVELDDLMYQIKKCGDGPTKGDNLKDPAINYKKFHQGIRDQIRKERFLKIKEREVEKKLQTYHSEILDAGSISIGEDLSKVSLEDAFFTPKQIHVSKSLPAMHSISRKKSRRSKTKAKGKSKKSK